MKTLDKVNLFASGGLSSNTDLNDNTQDPLYPEYLELVKLFEEIKQGPFIPGGYPDAPTFEGFKKNKKREQALQTMTSELEAGNVKKAYEEGFTQLPIGEQLLHYINPITGVPIETYETGYFTKEGGLGVKTPIEIFSDLINPNKNIFQKSFVKADDPLSAAIAPLSAIGALGGIAELANIPKAGLMMLQRINKKTMDGGGGGISELPASKQETTKDLAGTYSKTLEEAKAVSSEMSPQALLQYMKSNKRTNPSNNKTGTALTQSEIDEIDFSAFEEQYPNKDYTNEDILQYIDDNRIQLYRVSRAENSMYRGGDGDDSVEVYLDEPLTYEFRMDKQNDYDIQYRDFITRQIDFLNEHFPEGVINKQNFDAFKQRQRDFIKRRDIDTSGQAPSQLVNEFLVTNPNSNPYTEIGVEQFEFITPDGTLTQDLPPSTRQVLGELTESEGVEYLLEQGYSLKPKILDEDLNITDNIAEKAAESRIEIDYEDGNGDEAYRYVGPNDIYEIVGSENEGYNISVNGNNDEFFDEFIPLDEARIQIQQRELAEGNISALGNYDRVNSNEPLIDVLPRDVIEGGATIPTKYDEMSGFRLPMGGATDYKEHTIHIKNPKTATRYSSDKGIKHFGGGDELFHYRTTIRTDENGKEVLFVEEIQSDLHSTARSTKTDANYELPAKERQKLEKQLEQEFGLTSNNREGNRGFGNFFYQGESGTGGEKMIDIGALPFIARDIKEGRTANFGGKNADDFVESFGFEKTQEIGDLVAKLQQGQLPDFPYKGNAWVDAVTKDAMKLGAELDVDRVAFTNAATQMDRNNKSLNYVQDRIITKLKTLEEIKASDEYAADLKQSIDTEYKNFLADAGYPEGQELPSGALTKEQWLQTEPSGQTYDTVLDELTAFSTERQIALQDGGGQFKYYVEDVGYRLDDDEILNPQRIQMEGDDYDTQRINNTRLTNDEELLAEIPENFREQVKKDLAAGKKEITLNIDDLEGSGKKFYEIYKNGIIRGINKSVKDLKVDAKPDISNVLYATDPGYGPGQLFTDFKYLQRKNEFELDEFYDTLNQEPYRPTSAEVDVGRGLMLHKSIGIDLTPAMKQKLLADGYASMYMGGKVTKSNSMDRPIEGNRREM